MRHSLSRAVCLAGAALLASWNQAHAQGYNGYQQQMPYGGSPGFQAQGPGFGGQNGGGMQGGNPFLGAWTAQVPDQNGGTMVATTLFRPNGTFTNTGRMASGLLIRAWGQYRVQQVGPNQWRLDTRVVGHLPQQACGQVVGGGARVCHPTPLSWAGSSDIVVFNGSNILNNGGIPSRRDPQPVLLQAQVPAVSVQMVARPAPPPMPTPAPLPYPPTPRPNYNNDDNNQQAICALNDGSLVVLHDALKCINP